MPIFLLGALSIILMLVACKSPALPGEGKITPVAPRTAQIIDFSIEIQKPNYRFGVPLSWDSGFAVP
ncbi:MAG: hypothetical protein WAP23_04335, partial [Candidatus Spechtbacterales bacterium]